MSFYSTTDGRQHRILKEAITTSHRGHRVRVLLCEYDHDGDSIEHVIFAERADRPPSLGYHPADSFYGELTPDEQETVFREALFYQEHGYHEIDREVNE